MTDLSDISLSGLWRVITQDLDPVETKEWLDAFDAIVENEGAERATFILRKLLDHARMVRVPMPPVLNTPYANTISLADQPNAMQQLFQIQRFGQVVDGALFEGGDSRFDSAESGN